MAQKSVVHLIDDLDGGPAAETITFGLDGATYEIDLSEANAAKLRDVLAVYIGSARRGSPAPGGSLRRAVAGRSDREQTQAIRDWARKNGYAVGDKGRIPGSVREAYDNQQ